MHAALILDLLVSCLMRCSVSHLYSHSMFSKNQKSFKDKPDISIILMTWFTVLFKSLVYCCILIWDIFFFSRKYDNHPFFITCCTNTELERKDPCVYNTKKMLHEPKPFLSVAFRERRNRTRQQDKPDFTARQGVIWPYSFLGEISVQWQM